MGDEKEEEMKEETSTKEAEVAPFPTDAPQPVIESPPEKPEAESPSVA